MDYNIIDQNGNRFLKLEVIQVHQKAHSFYISKAPAKEVVDMFTVSPAKYDIKKYENQSKEFPDENEYYTEIINNKNNNMKLNFSEIFNFKMGLEKLLLVWLKYCLNY